jgi:serine/threonine protein kinase/formylglycine-generating enzyme required for sulfatase activity
MQFEEELLFRRIASEGQLITSEQLEECLEIQRNNPHATSLFVIMIEKGYITHKNMAIILKKIPPQVSEAMPLFTNANKKFGEMCVEKGFVSTVQVAECLSTQEKLKAEGRHFRIGQILMEKKFLTVHQAQTVLELQGKKILRCPTCETKFNIRHYQPHKKYLCPKCNGELNAFEQGSASLGVDRSVMTRETVEVDDETLNLINKKVGDYTITELLGEGGMASVYKAVSPSHSRPRALKIMKSQGGVERFTREFESASALRHPNIIRAYEKGTFDSKPYFFMEYIDGGTLSKRIEKMGVIPLTEGLNILRQVAMGLKYAHENNIVHRDIKPSNIMLSWDSNKKVIAKITDFGIARAVSDSHITMTGQLVGTFKYMSPEYIKGVGVDGKNDIFSLAVVAYEMFTGREPFNVDGPVGYLFVNIKETPPPIHQLNPDLPKEFALVVNQMMAKDHQKRYDAASLLRDLDRFLRHLRDNTPLIEPEDKTSAFYARSALTTLKGLWDKLAQRFSPLDSEAADKPIETEEEMESPEGEEMERFFQTQEVGKEATCQKDYEFALELLKKGNIDAARKNLEAVIEVFPGTVWAARAKKKLGTLASPEAPAKIQDAPPAMLDESMTRKKKIPLSKIVRQQETARLTSLPATQKKATQTVEAAGTISLPKQEKKRETESRPDKRQRDDTKDRMDKSQQVDKKRTATLQPIAPHAEFEAISSPKPTTKPETNVASLAMGNTIVAKAQEFLVSVKAFINEVRSIEEYERKQVWLDDVFSYVRQLQWDFAREEISEILYKWGRFLLDHGKYSEGLVRFWELYEKFANTRWYPQVLEELVSFEQPKDMTFIDGGKYTIGEGDNETVIQLDPYFIDIYPVTNAQYLEFIKETGYPVPVHWIGDMYPIGKGNHPVVWVSAEDAFVYACWCNKRLPVEQEWEKAARGPQRLHFPWGNVYETRKCNCRESGMGDTTPVGYYEVGKSYYHCYDMAGNIWQWTDSWYDNGKTQRVLRGGSWFSYETFTTATYRNFDFPGARSGLYGFRCLKSFCRPNKM